MSIKCCRYCVPPKRHIGCHSTCPEYTEERKEHTEKREAEYAKRLGQQSAYAIKDKAVTELLKKRRKH